MRTSNGEHMQVLLIDLEAKYFEISQAIASVIQFSCFICICSAHNHHHPEHHLLFRNRSTPLGHLVINQFEFLLLIDITNNVVRNIFQGNPYGAICIRTSVISD